MLHLELPHINVLSKIDLLKQYGELEFNLDFYTEVQELSYLENSLSSSLPAKFSALNMAMISLIEDFSLVGFETLAVEDKHSMLNLTRAIDRATGYVFIPPSDAKSPPEAINQMNNAPNLRPNEHGLFSSAVGPLKGPLSDVRDVQERWIDERDAYDAHERRQWRKEGETLRDRLASPQGTKDKADR
ncbi:hypothetical protein Ac2012v2_006789 [Leucoagaricus gongylophorus]